VPYERSAGIVLAEWRKLERRLMMIDPRSREAELLYAEAHALRDEYRHLIVEAAAHQRPSPEPFPDGLVSLEPDASRDEFGAGQDVLFRQSVTNAS
jgi:hypothetical protein